MSDEMPDMGILEQANDEQTERQNALVESQKEIQELVESVWQAKEENDKTEKRFKELKAQLTNIMDLAGVESIKGKNCNVSCKSKDSVSVPKEVMNKQKLFSYIENKYGRETLMSMQTISARSFSSWFESENVACSEAGETFEVLEYVKPYSRLSLSIRKSSKK